VINLVTCSDENYLLTKMGPWLDYTRNHASDPDVRMFMVTLGFTASPELQAAYPHIEFRFVSEASCQALNTNGCIQHGDWMSAFPEAKDDDIFVVIDGDALMQRPFSPSEKTYLSRLPPLAMAMNWNAGIGDTLGNEALRIFPTVHPDLILKDWCPSGWYPCHNAGVMAAKVSCWKSFFGLYVANWNRTARYFNHIARQQWLINWCAYQPPHECIVLPLSFHTHGHYGLFPGVTVEADSGTTLFKGEPVLFRHKIAWNPYGATPNATP
jgi:hypothetical protein